MHTCFCYAGKRTCPSADGAVVGSDSPPDCHSLPTLQVLFHHQKTKMRHTKVHLIFDHAGKRT